MTKTILITGATDGIGFETSKQLVGAGHKLLIHGRSEDKLAKTVNALKTVAGSGEVVSYCADLSDLSAVKKLAAAIRDDHQQLDVIINNAGVFRTPQPIAENGLDVRFVVNTLAPLLLTQSLLPLLMSEGKHDGRVVNLSSAAQASVDSQALRGEKTIADEFQAYAQSKLAITQWTAALAEQYKQGSDQHVPVFVAVNPGSMLGSKMVKEGFGVAGGDLSIGANILCKAALDESFSNASGQYFDNDAGKFAPPHSDAQDSQKNQQLLAVLEEMLEAY